MTTQQGVFCLGDLFSKNLEPVSNIEHRISNNLVRADIGIPVKNVPGLIVMCNKDTHLITEVISAQYDIRKKLFEKRSSLNGTARNYKLAVIQILPEEHKGKSLEVFKKVYSSIEELRQKHRVYSEIGKEIYEELIINKHHRSYSTIPNIMPYVRFNLLAKREKSEKLLKRMSCACNATGIYFIREHTKDRLMGDIVYVGKSTRAMVSTTKGHFRPRKKNPDRPDPYEECRGEDRGQWMRKLKKGYHYDVGLIIVPKPDNLSWKEFDLHILKMETIFIAALDPRDNHMKKPPEEKGQKTLFTREGAPITESLTLSLELKDQNKDTPSDDDFVPF